MPLNRARNAIRSGDLLGAYDAAMEAIADGNDSRELRFLHVLALARMGDTDRAQLLFDQYDLAADASEDVLALRARLLKDSAIAATDKTRAAKFERASAAYLAAHSQSLGYFSLVNAASLSRLAGSVEASHRLARRVLEDPGVEHPTSYFAAATAAEAWLLLGEADRATAAALRARALADADPGPRGSTVRQLKLLAGAQAVPAALVEQLCAVLRPPPVLFYAGHMFEADTAIEAVLTSRIETVLAASNTAIAYGALACGADILCAEAILRRGGAELHVVLPFVTADFIAQSVLAGGPSWLPRFEVALDAATSVTFASEAAFVGDPDQFQYGSNLAMGMSLLRAAHLHTSAEMIAVWDGGPPRGSGGTGGDVARWRGLGLVAHSLDPGAIVRPPAVAARPGPCPTTAARCQRAILFTDYAGFSRLGEHDLPGFWADVMGDIAAVLAAAGGAVNFQNSWGDAVFAVIDDLGAAARIALDIVGNIEGPASDGGMRVGLHFGPVYRMVDPITGADGYIGTEVTRAARIEPITPVGQVYVTQPFAAMLALAGNSDFRTEYAGKVTLAKKYGAMALYRLSR